MATVLQHLTRALRLIGALQEGEQPNAEQTADGITALSAMLAGWEGEGIGLGIAGTTLEAATVLPFPATHDEAVQCNLALRLAPEYAAAIHPVLADRADTAFRTLQGQYDEMIPATVEPALLRAGRLGWWGFYNG